MPGTSFELRQHKPRGKVSRGVLARRVIKELNGKVYDLGSDGKFMRPAYSYRVNGNRLEFLGKHPMAPLLARCMRYQPEIVAILTDGKSEVSGSVAGSLREMVES